MDNEKPPSHGGDDGGGLPPSSVFPVKSEPSSIRESENFGSSDAGDFSHDISRMSEFPPRNRGHRRAHSEILGLPDDISFDSNLGIVGSFDGPSLSDETEEDLFSMFLDIDKFGLSAATSGLGLLDGEASAAAAVGGTTNPGLQGESSSVSGGTNERPRIRHQHSVSMDGSTSIKPELLVSSSEGPSLVETKKAMSAANLAELSLIDPKRAKRIWANRQSAARSKERKMRYIAELERKVQTLQAEATTLSAQFAMLQNDTNGLTSENNELKLRVQNMEQQVHLQDALNDALREEVQRLKLATGQMISNGGPPMVNFGHNSFGANQQFYRNNHAMQSLMSFQQLQIHPQHQQQMYPHQQQLPAELKMNRTMASQNQRENISDYSSALKD